MDFILPELGENIESGDVVKIHVKVGDSVKEDDVLFELETDKAVVEVPSPTTGVISEILVEEGQQAKVGSKVMVIDAADAPAKKQEVDKKQNEKKNEEPKQKIEASKEIKQEEESFGEEDDDFDDSEETVKIEESKPRKNAPEEKSSSSSGDVYASPSIRRFARELGVNLEDVSPSGAGGRVTKDDVKKYLRTNEGKKSSSAKSSSATEKTSSKSSASKWGDEERKPMSRVRKVTAKNMTHAWTTIPHVTQCDEADITKVLKLRKKYATRVEQRGGKLTITAILLKVTAAALKVFPQFNASIDMDKEEIIFKKYINIGVAVDTDRGLLVPVIRDVDRKNILDLSVEMNELAAKARSSKTSIEEMTGGTFTISNLGGLGTTFFTPIINAPEVAILGIGRGKEEAVCIDGEWKTRVNLPLSLSYDHRLIDGADAARFLRWIAEAVQDPFLMDLEG